MIGFSSSYAALELDRSVPAQSASETWLRYWVACVSFSTRGGVCAKEGSTFFDFAICEPLCWLFCQSLSARGSAQSRSRGFRLGPPSRRKRLRPLPSMRCISRESVLCAQGTPTEPDRKSVV